MRVAVLHGLLADHLRTAADFFLPAGCAACQGWIPGGKDAALVCASCRGRLRPAPWPRCPRCHYPARGGPRADNGECGNCALWDPDLFAARYSYVLCPVSSRLVRGLKYGDWPELAEPLAEALVELELPASSEIGGGVEAGIPSGSGLDSLVRRVVAYVPATPDRESRRGYNQSKEIARRYAAEKGLPIVDLLERRGSEVSQTALRPTERFANVRDAFRPKGNATLDPGTEVHLVDDVLTTGATASAASAALVRCGAGRVILLTFARAVSELDHRFRR